VAKGEKNIMICPGCGKEKPLTIEYWYWRNDNKKWRPFCKVCHQKNRHKYKAVCVNCGNPIDATLEQIKKGEKIFCSHKCRTKEFLSNDAIKKMAKTWIKRGERLSPNTEFKKGEHRGHSFPKGNIPWNDSKTYFICDYCGAKVKGKPYQIKRYKNNYCGMACMSNAFKKLVGDKRHNYKGGRKYCYRESIKQLKTSYVKALIRSNGIENKDIIPEMIELKRQQIIMKRTLKQFKQWRKERENESGNTDVYGEQLTNEKDHEGHIQAG
jgi:hypothetical protein